MQTRVALSRRAAPARARLISIPIGGCIGRGMGAPDTLSTRHVRVSATRSCGPYEQDTGHRAVRGAEPTPNDRASTGQRDAKRGVEALNALPSDGRRFEHDQSCNGPCRPATLARDPGSKSCLAIQGRQHRLRIGHDGFRFDHEERAARRMPGKDVDGAAFGIDRERHLHGKVPAVQPCAVSRRTIDSTRRACDSSSNRSSCSPRQRTVTSSRPSSAMTTRSSAPTVSDAILPRSRLEIDPCDKRARVPRSSWRQPRRIRRARSDRPRRIGSTRQACWPALDRHFPGATPALPRCFPSASLALTRPSTIGPWPKPRRVRPRSRAASSPQPHRRRRSGSARSARPGRRRPRRACRRSG